MRPFDEERIGELLGALPPAPDPWVRAAQELPRARREIERLAALAEADSDRRDALLADLAAALRARGVEPTRRTVEDLRARLGQD